MSAPLIELEIGPTWRGARGRFIATAADVVDGNREIMRDIGRLAVRTARHHAPERTGELKRRIFYRTLIRGGDIVCHVKSGAPYTRYILEGTRRHIIRGNPYLSFYWPKVGRRVVFRFVIHPGTKPNNFMRRAWDDIHEYADKRLRQIALRVVSRLAIP